MGTKLQTLNIAHRITFFYEVVPNKNNLILNQIETLCEQLNIKAFLLFGVLDDYEGMTKVDIEKQIIETIDNL